MVPNRTKLLELQAALRIALDWRSGEEGAWDSLMHQVVRDPDLFLDLVDECILYATHVDQLVELRGILESCGSAWTLGAGSGGSLELERRVDATAKAAAQGAAAQGTPAAVHLARAWSGVYSRNPNASDAYREAVRAVEAVAQPVISPANTGATLGTMLADLRNKPSKWKTVMNPPAGYMMR